MICKLHTTLSVNSMLQETYRELNFTSEADEKRPEENGVINLYPQVQYQIVRGFGGAMTEAAGYCLAQLNETNQKAAIDAYFGKDGIGYQYLRTHIDSCDFSLNPYTAVADPEQDPDFTTFTIARDKKYIIPAIKKSLAASNGALRVLLSPWSPPACWKTPPDYGLIGANASESIRKSMSVEKPEHGIRSWGGHLKPEHYHDWARYVVKYINAYLDEGIPVKMVSVQNEAMASTPWDSCQWSAKEEQIYLRDFLYPELKKANLENKVGIYIWDHNKERMFERACDILDESTRPFVEGIAFHWYSGDHFEAVNLTHEAFPDKLLMFSEGCVEYSVLGNNSELSFGQKYAHDIIGDLNAGMNTFLDWNLYLDEKGGPNYVQNYCGAPIMLDGKGGFVKHFSWYYIGHFSRYIHPSARRIGFSRYSDVLEVTAFQNPDKTIAVVVLNRSDKNLPLNFRLYGMLCRTSSPALSILTAIIV